MRKMMWREVGLGSKWKVEGNSTISSDVESHFYCSTCQSILAVSLNQLEASSKLHILTFRLCLTDSPTQQRKRGPGPFPSRISVPAWPSTETRYKSILCG